MTKLTPHLLSPDANVTAIIIAIEEYQTRKNGQIPKVDYAINDANAFSLCLDKMFPNNDITKHIFLDSQATAMDIENEIKSAIYATDPDDLMVFYYAGHGFHNGISNMISVWNSHGHNLDTTCLNLRKILFDPLKKSHIKKSLTFIDACAVVLEEAFVSRSVITEMNANEFKEFIAINEYAGIFLSCEPGQKSYGHSSLGQGIWSYHLVEALSGRAKDAIDAHNFVTDTSLRDYLAKSVRRFITKKTSITGTQTPMAQISASNRFGICKILTLDALPLVENDFSALSFKPDYSYFGHIETRAYDRLPGFSKQKKHFVPDCVNDASSGFARELLESEIAEEIDEYYNAAKKTFKLRRDDIGTGDDTLDTEYFRFWINVRQTPDDPSEIQIERGLTVRVGDTETFEKIDEIFGDLFDSFICKLGFKSPDYDSVVRALEDVEITYGGQLEESERQKRVTYFMDEGNSLTVDLNDKRVSLCCPRKSSFLSILDMAQNVRLGHKDKPVEYLESKSQRI